MARAGRPVHLLAFASLFVVSGACALTYQVVWSRLLAEVFGVTAFAVSTVLVSFMGGMALGAGLLGRRADRTRRPLRMFAMLEAGIGVYALLLPWLLKLTDLLYAALWPALPDSFLVRSIVRFVLCLALLLVPTMLMGATLPALGRGLLSRRDSIGVGIGLLYFVNTLGASIGCFLAGFLMLPTLGLERTTWVAFAGNAFVATVAFLLDRRTSDDMPPAAADEAPAHETSPAWWPFAVTFGSGLAGLAFEVVWFRVLILVFGSTVYSFSAMLSVFLFGLALGSIGGGALADRVKSPVRLLAWTQGGVALFSLLGALAVNWMPLRFLKWLIAFGLDFHGINETKFLLSAIVLLPAALLFGATFPLVVKLAPARGRGTGGRIGLVYVWNTVGAILGSFGAGFVLLPTIGMERTLVLVILVSAVLAVGTIAAEKGSLQPKVVLPTGIALAAIAAIALFGPRWNRALLGAGVYFEPQNFIDQGQKPTLDGVLADYQLMTYTEGYNETIISYESPKGRFITVNGSTTASNHFEDMFIQRMLGDLPMALAPVKPKKACIICLGAGVTAGSIALYDVDRLIGVEIEKGVFVASRFFEKENNGLLDNPKLEVKIDDGKNYLKLTKEKFDVISSAPNFPSLTGSGALFSKEFFEIARARLAPGGVICQFVPIWRMQTVDVGTILGTFADVFPYVRVFHTGLSLVVLGRMEPFPPVDVAELTRRIGDPKVAASLREIGVRGPIEFLSYYQFDEAEARKFSEGAPRNTDDRPRTEFFAPRSLFSSTVGINLDRIRELRPSPEERARRLGLQGDDREAFLKLAAGTDAVAAGESAMLAGRFEEGIALVQPVADSGQRYACNVLADYFEKSGQKLQAEGHPAEAKAAFELARRYEPDRLESLVGVGYLDLFDGHFEEAETLLTRAVALYPRSAGAAYRLGALRQMQGRTDDAERLYRNAIERSPRLGPPRGLLGGLLLARGDATGALEQFDAAVALGDTTEGVMAGRDEARRKLAKP
ncbi:MAG TPA: fused MFS/spermidine synthase [Candidatus Polarisedimenticolaceae bacterium]|nr:fused MFS/spermidine synthase [Candidatus Polarisedimenticolaceae bacterium]